ncbi:unnamed protein product [Durusdinium trenchii]|uniref:Uncharacterized protein n=1 Tax=Durusdinium trenchii TaxID=1381693 RepID=A0ABP0S4L9_9DINO
MRLRGDRGDYIADGARHEISQIQRRREGSLVVADFSWKNVAGASGKGQWLVSVDGAFIAGQWRQDGVEEGPWSWYGRRKPSLGNPLPPELARSSAQEEAVPVPDLGPSIIQAARELVATYRDKEPLAKERLAKAWEDAAPRLGAFGGAATTVAGSRRRASELLRPQRPRLDAQVAPGPWPSSHHRFAVFAEFVLCSRFELGLGQSSRCCHVVPLCCGLCRHSRSRPA